MANCEWKFLNKTTILTSLFNRRKNQADAGIKAFPGVERIALQKIEHAEREKREENFYVCVQDLWTKRFSRYVAQRSEGKCGEDPRILLFINALSSRISQNLDH